MLRVITYLVFLFVAVGTVAQVNVSGTVVDKESNEPLTGASVIVKGTDGKIKKYSTLKGDGGFLGTGNRFLRFPTRNRSEPICRCFAPRCAKPELYKYWGTGS